MGNLQDIFNDFIASYFKSEEMYSIVGTAGNINESERTCDVSPLNGNADILGVRLQASLDSTTGFVQIPANGSKVVVTFINPQTGFVALCETVDKILIDTALVQFNGGSEDGMVKINDLITKLNNAENKINSIITLLKTWTVVPGDGGAALKATATSIGALTPTVKSELENTAITQ